MSDVDPLAWLDADGVSHPVAARQVGLTYYPMMRLVQDVGGPVRPVGPGAGPDRYPLLVALSETSVEAIATAFGEALAP